MNNLVKIDSSRLKNHYKNNLATISQKKLSKQFHENQNYQIKSALNFNHQQIKFNILCAFHPQEKITNFCKNKNCLLPLCPKCIKIHTDEHAKMGILGSFETIEEIMSDARKLYGDNINFLCSLMEFVEQVHSSIQIKVINFKRTFDDSRLKMIKYINELYLQYEQRIDKQIRKQNEQFEHQLQLFYQQTGQLLQQCRKNNKKLETKHLIMEAIINLYSQGNIKHMLSNYQQKIIQIIPKQHKLNINQFQLERIKSIIKKYIQFDQNDQKIHEQLKQQYLKSYNHTSTLEKKIINELQYTNQKNNNNNKFKNPLKSQQNIIPINFDTFTPTNNIHKSTSVLQKFNSPLDRFQLRQQYHK